MLTTEQIELRRTGVTATDVAAIVGLSPFAGPMDVYLEKLGLADPVADNEAMRWGRDLEPLILKRYAADNGVDVETPGTLRHPEHPELLGTPDGLVAGGRRGVEIKTAGPRTAHFWGEPGSDAVPPQYYIQCAVYMAICGAEAWDLAVLIGGQDYRVYTIERDSETEAWLVDSALRFWRSHVLAGVPPPVDGRAATARFLAHQYPSSNGLMRGSDLECELWAERLREARAAVTTARALESEAENRLKAKIGEADGLKGSFFTVYWRRARDASEVDYRAVLDELAAGDPEIARRCEELVARHTRVRQGTRSFRTYFNRGA